MRGAHAHTMEADTATPIWISRRTHRVLAGAGAAALVLLLWRVPTLVALFLGGGVLAIVLSFPVRALSRLMPRGAAIALSLVAVAALVVLAIAVAAPIVLEQLGALVAAAPDTARQLEERGPSVLDWLGEHGLLPGSPAQFLDDVRQRILAAMQAFAGRLVGGLGQFVAGVAGVAVLLLGIVFVAVFLLTDARRIQAAVLRATPHRYRRDVRALWDAFGHTISRYLGALTLSVTIEGIIAAIALHLLGVPYAFLLGAWVSVTALIPYVGAWIGYAPAVLLALAISPTRALLTLVLCLLINMLVGNVLAPRIQGQAVRVHPILVFLAVVVGGALFGIPGVVLATPTVAVLRVLFDFFRVRVRVAESPSSTGEPSREPSREHSADGRLSASAASRGAGRSGIVPPVSA